MIYYRQRQTLKPSFVYGKSVTDCNLFAWKKRIFWGGKPKAGIVKEGLQEHVWQGVKKSFIQTQCGGENLLQCLWTVNRRNNIRIWVKVQVVTSPKYCNNSCPEVLKVTWLQTHGMLLTGHHEMHFNLQDWIKVKTEQGNEHDRDSLIKHMITSLV